MLLASMWPGVLRAQAIRGHGRQLCGSQKVVFDLEKGLEAPMQLIYLRMLLRQLLAGAHSVV